MDKQYTELPAPNTCKSCKYSICLESSNNPGKQGWKYYTHLADEKTEGRGLLKYEVKLVSVGPELRTLVTHSTCSLSGTPVMARSSSLFAAQVPARTDGGRALPPRRGNQPDGAGAPVSP